MWSLRNLFLLLPLLVAACGFQPMYGAKNENALKGGIRIDTAKDALGQQFQKDLEDKLNIGGMPPRPAYALVVKLSTVSEAIGVARDGTVSRFNVRLTSSYQLIRLADNKEIKRGDIHHVSSYNNQANQYFSTYVSEKDAISRGITELSELYRQRIGAIVLKAQSA